MNNEDSLVARVEEIKGEIANVLLEIDNINLQVNPQIVAEYMVRVGCWENELLRAQIAARRARRKCELAQAAANKRECVDPVWCEKILTVEFAQWEEELTRQMQSLTAALDRQASYVSLSHEEARELKALHRTLVKRLHPDMHPEQDENARNFFALAQRAYEMGDVHMLRAVELATSSLDREGSNAVDPNQSEEDLLLEISLLEAQLGVYVKQLASLKASNPYALGAKVFDDRWVESTVADLKERIAEQEEVALTYERRFNALHEEAKNHAA